MQGLLTVNGVSDEEESHDGMDEGSARGVLALKVTLLVASEGVGSSRLLGGSALGELVQCTIHAMPSEQGGGGVGQR